MQRLACAEQGPRLVRSTIVVAPASLQQQPTAFCEGQKCCLARVEVSFNIFKFCLDFSSNFSVAANMCHVLLPSTESRCHDLSQENVLPG